jgi:hypothetical protein
MVMVRALPLRERVLTHICSFGWARDHNPSHADKTAVPAPPHSPSPALSARSLRRRTHSIRSPVCS